MSEYPNKISHIPVLLKEVILALIIKSDDTVVDATVNGGGHAKVICKQLGKKGTFIGVDLDRSALERAQKQLQGVQCRVFLEENNYRNLDIVLKGLGIEKVDSILFDLGLSSLQLEESGRGFSFKKDEPLLLTFKKDPIANDLTGREILNRWDEEHIANIIYGYGEERYARGIARKIIETRKKHPILSTVDLVRIVEAVLPGRYKYRKIHPATKVFQALRIAVNDELGTIEEGLSKALQSLKQGGQIAVISFHSIEDRVVKIFFNQKQKEKIGIVITKKPIIPNRNEIKNNPRARSAKLRIFKKEIETKNHTMN